jgi:hypothetical protein
MAPASVVLLVGIAGVAASVLALVLTVVRARRAAAMVGAVPDGLVLRAVALGAGFVVSIALVVTAVLLI